MSRLPIGWGRCPARTSIVTFITTIVFVCSSASAGVAMPQTEGQSSDSLATSPGAHAVTASTDPLPGQFEQHKNRSARQNPSADTRAPCATDTRAPCATDTR